MIPFAQEMVSHWPYVVGSLSFAASVLACILGLQRVMKTREEIHKLKLETEAKEDERRARINEEKSEQSGVIFESIAINRGNDEWKEVELADLHIEPKHRLEKAASFLQNVDLSNIRYFQINGFFYLSIPSFDIIIANRSKKGVLVTEVGVRAIYVADSDMDMPGGGGEESFYKVPRCEIYTLDALKIFDNLQGAEVYESELTQGIFDTDEEYYRWTEWKIDRLIKPGIYRPYVIKAGGRLRYAIRLKNWPIHCSAILRLWIATGSGERQSDPLYIRYGGSVSDFSLSRSPRPRQPRGIWRFLKFISPLPLLQLHGASGPKHMRAITNF